MTRLYFVACFICACFSASGRAPLYGLTGQKVALVPDATGTEQPEEILWKHNGNKVVEFDGKTQTAFGLFQSRVVLDWISAELMITDLRSDDSGEYDLEVYANQMLRKQTLNLMVLEKVAKPNVKCERSIDGDKATLTCSSESRQPQFLTYEWIKHGPGPNLTVTLTDKNDEYTCMVRNPLTNATATFPTKGCYPGASVAVIAGVSIAVAVILIAAVVGIIWCKKKSKACFTGDAEKAADESYGLNGETGRNEEGTHLIHRTPTVPSDQRLVEIPSNSFQQFEAKPLIRDLFPGTATELQKQVHDDGGEKSPPAVEDKPPVPLPRMSQQFPAVGTEDTAEHNQGLNSEAPQNKQNNPHSEPSAPPGQQPVNLPQDNNNITFTCNEPDKNIKNDRSEKDDGKGQTPARKGNVADLRSKFEQIPEKQAELQKQVPDDGGEKSPPAVKVKPPVPLPRMSQQFPAVGTEDTPEHNQGTDSNQVTDKTEEENVEQYLDNNNQSVSDETKPDNDQSLSPPEEPDQHAEPPDAAHSDLDQQNDKTRLDSPECEEQSDSNTTDNEGDKSEDEGDADENEAQCSANVEKSDKESEDEDEEEKDVCN